MSVLLFIRFRQLLLDSFDEQIIARAGLVAEKTNVQPRIVPLPQGAESFTIIYITGNQTDTLFRPARVSFTYPSPPNQFSSANGWRATNFKLTLESGGAIEVVYALPSNSIDGKLRELTFFIWLALPFGCLIAAITGFWLSSRLLKPVRQVINLANAINLNNNTSLIDEPLPPDELKELIVSFNRMLLRIKEQSERQAAFFASASHELRTPLSLMQTRLQVLLQDQQNTEPVNQLYADQLREVKQLNKMVNDFLLMSEVQHGNISLIKSSVNIPELLLEAVKRYQNKTLLKKMHVKISYQPVEESYNVYADEGKLLIIVGNLLDNAVKYAPAGSLLDILITSSTDQICILFTNKIRGDINPVITDLKNQFYHSKPLHGEGYGLGLWIANQLAIMHEFELFCTIDQADTFAANLVMGAETK